MPEVGLVETAVTKMGLGGTISWPKQWGNNLLASTTELVIRLKDATVKYTMEWTLLIIPKAKIDVVGIRPHKQQLIKVDGSKKLTIMNRRLVRELEPRKTSLEDQPPMSNMEPPPVLVVDRKKMTTPSTKTQVMCRQHLQVLLHSLHHRHHHLQCQVQSLWYLENWSRIDKQV